MDHFPEIAEQLRQGFETRNQARDRALAQARQLTRFAAHAIRALHRSEFDLAAENIAEAAGMVAALKADLAAMPDLFYAGYTQDAIKEYAEACTTSAMIQNLPLPIPDELGIEPAAYVNGLAESIGELRRRCMDILRSGYSTEAERLLGCMDEIYAVLVTLDYPDAVTNGLRRQTDLVRGIIERTRGDLTISLREQQLEHAMTNLLARLGKG
jgi:translin